MKKIIKLSSILFLVFSMTSCMIDGVNGDGNVISKKRKISRSIRFSTLAATSLCCKFQAAG